MARRQDRRRRERQLLAKLRQLEREEDARRGLGAPAAPDKLGPTPIHSATRCSSLAERFGGTIPARQDSRGPVRPVNRFFEDRANVGGECLTPLQVPRLPGRHVKAQVEGTR